MKLNDLKNIKVFAKGSSVILYRAENSNNENILVKAVKNDKLNYKAAHLINHEYCMTKYMYSNEDIILNNYMCNTCIVLIVSL